MERVDYSEIETEKNRELVRDWLGSGSINVFGRPFAGKDSQCARLGGWLDAPVVGGGDIIRTREEARHLRESHDRGELAPTNEFVKVTTAYLGSPEFAGRPLVLSSLGRWSGEEVPILSAAEASGHPVKAVVYVDISEQTANDRLDIAGNRGRDDDNAAVLANRFREFDEKTVPVIGFYEEAGMLIHVDGEQSQDKVEADILKALVGLAKESTEDTNLA